MKWVMWDESAPLDCSSENDEVNSSILEKDTIVIIKIGFLYVWTTISYLSSNFGLFDYIT